MTAIVYGADKASQPDANPLVRMGIVVAGFAIGGVAFYQARRERHPLIDVSTLEIPTFSVTVVTGSLTRIGIGAVPYLLPLMFQIGFGLSPFESGLLLIASAVGNLGMKALTTPSLRRYGFSRVAIAGCTRSVAHRSGSRDRHGHVRAQRVGADRSFERGWRGKSHAWRCRSAASGRKGAMFVIARST